MPPPTPMDHAQYMLGHRIDRGRLQLVSVLGLGAYGVVYEAVDLAHHGGNGHWGASTSSSTASTASSSSSSSSSGPPTTRRRFAIKTLPKASLDSRQRQFQRREIALHQLASAHKNVVTMHRMIEEGDFVFVIMDLCGDGDLFSLITDKKIYQGKDDLIRRIFLQLIDATSYIHSLGIHHRDLKPENILTTDRGANVYLGDFGLATTEKTSSDLGCGSTFYMSPECHGDPTNPNTPPRPYSTRQNDTWSLGVILVNLITGRNPWRQADVTDDTYRAFLADPTVLQTILPISDEAWACLRRVFVPEAERIGLRELRGMIQGVKRFSVGSSPPPPPPPPPPSVLARPSSTTRQPVDRPFSTYQPWNHLPSLSPCPFPSSVYPNTSFLSFGNEHDLPHHLPPLVAQTSSSSDDDPVFPLTPEAWSPFTGTGTGHAFQVGLNSAYASGSGVNGTVIGTESGRGRRFEEYSPRGQGAVYAPISNALSTTTTKTRKEERFYSPWPTREHQIHGGFTPAPSALTTKTRLESFQYSTIPCSKRDRDPSLQQPQQLPCDLHEEGLVPSRFRPGTQRYYTHTHAREAIPDSTIEGYFNV